MNRIDSHLKPPHFHVIDRSRRQRPEIVATLGPSGTSSERAANRVLDVMDARDGWVALYRSYHDAADAVLSGEATCLVVANAFHEASVFYMEPRLRVGTVFHMLTPLYGLAARDVGALEDTFEVVSHPAPVPLISELIPNGYSFSRVHFAESTSAAAELVAAREHLVALTTEPAARTHGLRFFSRLRPIEMVWTTFVLDVGEGGDGAEFLN